MPPGGSASEAWRLECEARHVLSLPFDRRVPYLALVGRKRGADAQRALEAEVRKQFAKQRTSVMNSTRGNGARGRRAA
ncbi:DUF7696 family protein [Bordetella bronchiseptica]|uniref:DUF7696 family protein n=1 Tax=Bordetella bronchiseptica TaxID=518 RepID=UPI003AAEBA0B